MACIFCDVPIYTKIKKFSKSLAAPITPEGAIRQQLEDLTGETYAEIDHCFCPICGQALYWSGVNESILSGKGLPPLYESKENKTEFLFSRRNKNE